MHRLAAGQLLEAPVDDFWPDEPEEPEEPDELEVEGAGVVAGFEEPESDEEDAEVEVEVDDEEVESLLDELDRLSVR